MSVWFLLVVPAHGTVPGATCKCSFDVYGMNKGWLIPHPDPSVRIGSGDSVCREACQLTGLHLMLSGEEMLLNNPSPTQLQAPCLPLSISLHISLACSWTDPPSRCARQRRGSRPFPSFASLMPRTGCLCLSIPGEAAQPGWQEDEGRASLPPGQWAIEWGPP